MSELRRELNQARADLQQTSNEIKRRLAYDELRLERQVKDNPATSLLIGAGVGFLIGRASHPSAVLLALLTGAVIGYSLNSEASGRSEQPQ